MRYPFAMLLRLAAGLAVIFPTLGCTPARLLNAVTSKDGFRVEAGIPYGKEARQQLDLYIPDGPLDQAKVVVFFYGGRWEYGARGDYLFVGQALARQGYIAVLADYRLYPAVMYPTFIEDGADTVRWVKDHIADYGGDPGQIFLMGHSAGAYNVAMLAVAPGYLKSRGMEPSELAGVVGLAGPYDFLPIKDPVIKEIFDVADLEATQPVFHATAKTPPMLLLTGDNDETVYPRNSLALADRINQSGGEAIVKVYDGIAHVGVVLSFAYPFRWLAPVLKDVSSFLNDPKTASIE